MITYLTNWMGPINEDWLKEHGDHWAAGRIDIYGVPGEHYPIEYSLPPMHVEDWNKLSDWLDTLETEELWSFEDLIGNFQLIHDTKIRWWKNETRKVC